MIWLLIGYIWLFIHRPFEIWPWLGALRVELKYMQVMIVCWLLSGPQLVRGNRLHWYHAMFIAAIITSWLLSPFEAKLWQYVENYLKYAVFYVLLITTVRNRRDLRTVMLGYFGVVTLLMIHALREYYSGNAWYSQGMVRMMGLGGTFADFNDLAGLLIASLPLAWVFWKDWAGTRKRWLVLGHVGLACWCVVLTGSRMGIIGLILASLLGVLASPLRWRLLALLVLAAPVAWSVLPEDNRQRYYTLWDPTSGPASAQSSAGNYRLGGFESGMELFAQRPLVGIGPGGHGLATGTGLMPHNLYGQLLGELGLFGAVAFALLAMGVAQNTLDARRIMAGDDIGDDLFAWRVVAATAVSYLFLLIMGWGFNFLLWHVWLWFGAFQAVALTVLHGQVMVASDEKAAGKTVTEICLTACP